MRKVILDTDTLSEIYKGHDQTVRSNAEAYLQQFDKLTFTSVTAGEFLFGLHAKDARKQMSQAKTFLRANEEIVPSSADYWLMAEINGMLRSKGLTIGSGDTLIASCVINRGLHLATGNTKHYKAVIEAGFDLDIVDWRLK